MAKGATPRAVERLVGVGAAVGMLAALGLTTVIKNTSLKEGMTVQFRAEAINAFNHAQFLAPNDQHRVRSGNGGVDVAARDSVRPEGAVLGSGQAQAAPRKAGIMETINLQAE